MTLRIETLTPDSFAPFGQVIQQPERPRDAAGPGWQWWGENVQMRGGDRPYAIGYLDLKPAPQRFDWAERHMHSDELIVPLGGDCLVYVAPADFPNEPGRLPAFERFRVFRVPSGQGVLLKPGVWHGAPLALEQPVKALVMLLHNTGKQDVYIARFEDHPLEIAGQVLGEQ